MGGFVGLGFEVPSSATIAPAGPAGEWHDPFAVVAFTPKAGMAEALAALVRKHVAVLRSEELATDRAVCAMRAADGTIVEIFEWKSAEAIQAAHSNTAVQALLGEFGAACDYVPLAQIPEARNLFAEFEPIELE